MSQNKLDECSEVGRQKIEETMEMCEMSERKKEGRGTRE